MSWSIFSFSPCWTGDGWPVPSYRVFSCILWSYCCSHGLVQPQLGNYISSPDWRAWQVCAHPTPSQPAALHCGASGCWANIADRPVSKGLGPRSPRRGPTAHAPCMLSGDSDANSWWYHKLVKKCREEGVCCSVWLEEGRERENSNELISCSETFSPLCSCF